jgi:hypothetical protein
MEINIYIKYFDTIKEFDVKPSYTIFRVKIYIRKYLSLSNFDLYYNSNKIINGTIMSNNITEDTTIIIVPIMMTGVMTGVMTKTTNNNNINNINIHQLKYDSLKSVKNYITTNFPISEIDINKNINKNINILSETDIELNMKTKKKLQMLKQLYSK